MPFGTAWLAMFCRPIAPAPAGLPNNCGGTVQINYPAADPLAPFGGYQRSGNGREYGEFRLGKLLELETITG